MINVSVEVQCPFCGRKYKVKAPYEGFYRWQGGEHIQDAMPNMSITARECLISGVCPDCQKEYFDNEGEAPEVSESVQVIDLNAVPTVGDFGNMTGTEILAMLKSALED